MSANRHNVAIFGANGRVGEGILRAVLRDRRVGAIYVVGRRFSPLIEDAVRSNSIVAVRHERFLKYEDLRDVLTEIDATYWALGISATKVDKNEYKLIHTDFPMHFARVGSPGQTIGRSRSTT